MKIAETTWEPQNRLISTQISGVLDEKDVDTWQRSLEEALAKVEANSQFKIFVNLHGFKAANLEVHKKFRVIIPLTLAKYGWRVGYLDMFPEAKVDLEYRRGIRCVAAVHVHQDETKIANYQTNYSRPNEHYYIDPMVGETWIRNYQIENNSL